MIARFHLCSSSIAFFSFALFLDFSRVEMLRVEVSRSGCLVMLIFGFLVARRYRSGDCKESKVLRLSGYIENLEVLLCV